MKKLKPTPLMNLLNGNIKKELSIIIKFYSETCPLCHKIKPQYDKLAKKYKKSEFHFCVFNVSAASPYLKIYLDELGMKGVPSFMAVKIGPKSRQIRLMDSVLEHPDPEFYYSFKDMEDFINNVPSGTVRKIMEGV